MNYRPITDVWILARSKVKYHGAFPAGFLHRARALLGIHLDDPVLHVCAGQIREYPYAGLGPNDRTLDLDGFCDPDYYRDAREPLPRPTDPPQTSSPDGPRPPLTSSVWAAVLIDRPYTPDDADAYEPGADALPNLDELLKHALDVVAPGSRVGVLDYLWPRPPSYGKEVAVVAVGTGRSGRARWYVVFERTAE